MRALVLAGGGAKGAYQAGALLHMMDICGRQYDLISGTSVGAINAAYLAHWAPKDGKTAAKMLAEIWRTLSSKNIYKRWAWFGKLAVIWKGSLYDSRPLHRFLEENLNAEAIEDSGMKLRVTATDMEAGVSRVYDEGHPLIVKAVQASSAVPGVFLPVQVGGAWHTDGGVLDMAPLKPAIDAGATEIDVILLEPEAPSEQEKSEYSAFDVATRSIDLMMKEITRGDLFTHKQAQIMVVRPNTSLTSDSLDFDQPNVRKMMRRGLLDARRVFA